MNGNIMCANPITLMIEFFLKKAGVYQCQKLSHSSLFKMVPTFVLHTNKYGMTILHNLVQYFVFPQDKGREDVQKYNFIRHSRDCYCTADGSKNLFFSLLSRFSLAKEGYHCAVLSSVEGMTN